MRFQDVIGQQRLKEQLIGETRSGRVPHAQLFLSRPGTGGLPLALAYAQFLNCEQPGETDSCGECPSCRKSDKITHPDIHFSFPSYRLKSGKPNFSRDFFEQWREAATTTPYMSEYDWLQFIKAGNKQGNISADECRELIRQLQLKNYEGRYKVQIIWKAEALGREGNILLKLLEEPPPNTVLILVVESQELILNTILSRTQLRVLDDLTADQIEAALLDRGETEGEAAARIAFLADGNYHRALELSRKTTHDLFQWLDTWMTASMNSDVGQLLEFNSYLSGQGREKVKHFFEYLLHFFRECLSLRFRAGEAVRLTRKEQSLAERMWKFADLDRIARVIGMVEERHYHVERNVNAKYILLDMSIRMRRILRGQEV